MSRSKYPKQQYEMFQCKYISIKGVNETSKKTDDGFGTVNEHNYK